MDASTTDVARRLAEHPQWRWMPGMLAVYSDDGSYARRFRGNEPDGAFLRTSDRGRGMLPDLDDPATWGCILADLIAVDSGCHRVMLETCPGLPPCVETTGPFPESPEMGTSLVGDTPGHAVALAWLAAMGETT